MATQTVAGIHIDRCHGCGGIWLDAMEAEALHPVCDDESSKIDSDPPKSAQDATPDLHCPRCKTVLMTLMVESTPPICFENCGTCYGVFLDAGEFKAMRSEPLEKWLRATIPGVFRLRFPPAD